MKSFSIMISGGLFVFGSTSPLNALIMAVTRVMSASACSGFVLMRKLTFIVGDVLIVKYICLPNVCGDLPLAGARRECTDGQ